VSTIFIKFYLKK